MESIFWKIAPFQHFEYLIDPLFRLFDINHKERIALSFFFPQLNELIEGKKDEGFWHETNF